MHGDTNIVVYQVVDTCKVCSGNGVSTSVEYQLQESEHHTVMCSSDISTS